MLKILHVLMKFQSVVYFNKIPNDRIESTTYKANINGVVNSGNACKQGEFLEFSIENDREIVIELILFIESEKIFEFCTNC